MELASSSQTTLIINESKKALDELQLESDDFYHDMFPQKFDFNSGNNVLTNQKSQESDCFLSGWNSNTQNEGFNCLYHFEENTKKQEKILTDGKFMLNDIESHDSSKNMIKPKIEKVVNREMYSTNDTMVKLKNFHQEILQDSTYDDAMHFRPHSGYKLIMNGDKNVTKSYIRSRNKLLKKNYQIEQTLLNDCIKEINPEKKAENTPNNAV